MRKILASFFLRKTDNWKFWMLLALLVKGTFFCFLLYANNVHTYAGFWGVTAADSHDYIAPIENLVAKGEYMPDHRMPGYGIIYLPLFLFFTKTVALNVLIMIQCFAAAVSVYLLAMIAKYLFQSDKYFYLVYYLFLTNIYLNFYDHLLLTESFTCSFLIIAVYFFIRALLEKKNVFYFLSGIFLTDVVFLRPVFFPLFFLFLFVLVWEYLPRLKKTAYPLLFFLIPFFISESMWVLHNYKKHNRIQLLMDAFLPGELNENYYRPCLEFCQSWGGNYIWWKEGTPIRWFGVGVIDNDSSLISLIQKEKIKIPKTIYTSKFNEDSLVKLRSLISEIKKEENISPWSSQRIKNENLIKSTLDTYSQSIKKENPFVYYIKSRINYCKYFFLTTRSNNPFAIYKNIIANMLKRLELFNYLFILITGMIGIILLTKACQRNLLLLIAIGIPIYTMVIHPIVLRLIENRYFMPAYSFLILSSAYCIVNIYNLLYKSKNKVKNY